MITLLGALLGFISSLCPEILKIFQDRKDKAHELAIMQLQIERESKGYANRLEAIQIQALAKESEALYRTYKTGIEWVDALNGSVRPVLAYAFFALYASIKLCQFSMIYDTPWRLWTEEDGAIFAGIISFYFGSRAMQKRR